MAGAFQQDQTTDVQSLSALQIANQRECEEVVRIFIDLKRFRNTVVNNSDDLFRLQAFVEGKNSPFLSDGTGVFELFNIVDQLIHLEPVFSNPVLAAIMKTVIDRCDETTLAFQDGYYCSVLHKVMLAGNDWMRFLNQSALVTLVNKTPTDVLIRLGCPAEHYTVLGCVLNASYTGNFYDLSRPICELVSPVICRNPFAFLADDVQAHMKMISESDFSSSDNPPEACARAKSFCEGTALLARNNLIELAHTTRGVFTDESCTAIQTVFPNDNFANSLRVLARFRLSALALMLAHNRRRKQKNCTTPRLPPEVYELVAECVPLHVSNPNFNPKA